MAEEILYNKVVNITFYTQINGRLKGKVTFLNSRSNMMSHP